MIIVIVAATFIFSSCEEYKDKNLKTDNSEVLVLDMNKLPVYYNGLAMNVLLEDFQKPVHKNVDMEDVTMLTIDAVHIFDVDAAFYEFCIEVHSLEMYRISKLLDSVYEKAVELDLLEKEMDEIPVEMLNYYEQLFKTSFPVANRNVLGRLYKTQNYSVDYYGFWPVFWPSFGSYNNQARSVQVTGLFLSGWLCTKKWFGKPRLGYVRVQTLKLPTLPPAFDKNLCSAFGF